MYNNSYKKLYFLMISIIYIHINFVNNTFILNECNINCITGQGYTITSSLTIYVQATQCRPASARYYDVFLYLDTCF